MIISSVAYTQEDEVIHLEESLEQDQALRSDTIVPEIFLVSKMTEEGMLLRWAPNTTNIWLDGIDNGYILERKMAPKDSTIIATYEPLSQEAIKPWNLDQWKTIMSEDKLYVLAAAQCILDNKESDETGFVLKSEDYNNRLGFNLLAADLDREAAIASGLGFLDPEVEIGDIVNYRLRLKEPILSSYRDTAKTFGFGVIKEVTAPKLLEPSENENSVSLSWKKDNGFSAFYVERSENGVDFSRLSETPFVDMKTEVNYLVDRIVYVDSLATNDKSYYYRIQGINSFAQLSLYSNVVEARGQDRTPPNTPVNVTAIEDVDGLVVINWDWQDFNGDNDLIGFHVLKSNDVNIGFDTISTNLLPPGANKFIDESPDIIQTNYYKIVAVDNNNNHAESAYGFLITEDDVPPAAPTNIQADIDSAGMLLLTWDPPADDDVRGYLVHFSNGRENNFAVIPGKYLIEPYYLDSLNLNTLTEEIYYYVVALDLSYNASEISEIVEVKRPDIIPPTASIFVDYKVSDQGIYFEWVRSTSDDVVDIVLERKGAEGTWMLIDDFDQQKQSYTDVNVEDSKLYSYRLKTIDDAGLFTYNKKPLTLEALTPFFLKDIEDVQLKKEKEGVALTWSYNNASDYRFVIYRKGENGKLKTYKILDGETTFVDTAIQKKENYSYAVKVEAKDGRESKISELVSSK